MFAQSEWPSFLEWMPDGFDSWEAWVAIGTLALAGATVFLGWQAKSEAAAVRSEVEAATDAARAARESAEATRESAAAALRSAEIAERAFIATIRPVLADALSELPSVVQVTSTYVLISVPVRNVGSGLALIRETRLLRPSPPGSAVVRATTRGGGVPSGDVAWITFHVGLDDRESARAFSRELTGDAGFTADVRYTDVDGQQPARIEATARHDNMTDWGVTIAQFHGEDISPYGFLGSRNVNISL